MKTIKIAFFSSEIGPFAKVGGLGDVAGSLPKELQKLGTNITVLSAKYQQTDLNRLKTIKTSHMTVKFGKEQYRVGVHKILLPNSRTPAVLFENQTWLSRGAIYEPPKSVTDPHYLTKRFLFLSVCGIEFLKTTAKQTDILHANDWTSAFTILLAKKTKTSFNRTKTLLSVHNITHGGFVNADLAALGGLDVKNFSALSQSSGNNKYFDSFYEAAFQADAISTVSPTYATQLLQPEYGQGLEKILRFRKLKPTGILNGIDTEYFNPATDPYIFAQYNTNQLALKWLNKLALQKLLRLRQNKDLLCYGVITRLNAQKGIELILEVIKKLSSDDSRQFVILGEGETRYVKALKELENSKPGYIKFINRYDAHLARQIYAGSDIFLMPSKFEPCGLTQMIAMRYGTLPIVHDTGGLSDTVIDQEKKGGNGFVFKTFSAAALLTSIKTAEQTYHSPRHWQSLQQRAMAMDFSWRRSAKEYLKLYQKLLKL